MGFRESFEQGQQTAKIGIDAYDRARSWSERLTEKEQAKEAAKAARKLEAERHTETRGDKAADDYSKTVKERREYDIKMQEMADLKKYREDTLNLYKTGARGNKQTAAKDLTPNAAAAAAFNMLKGYGGDPSTMPEDEFVQYQSYLAKANPSHKPQAFKKPERGMFGRAWDSFTSEHEDTAPAAPPAFDWRGQ
mgnify:FL=1